MHTSRNLLSCLSCPFSARNCVTMRIASVMMDDLSVFAALPGSSTLERSEKLQTQLEKVTPAQETSNADSVRRVGSQGLS